MERPRKTMGTFRLSGAAPPELKLIPTYVNFEVFTAVTIKNTVFRDIRTQFIPRR
jgi:hypothetical protein